MSTVPKIQNRVWKPMILPHITEKNREERRQTIKGALVIAVVLAWIALLIVWPVAELPR